MIRILPALCLLGCFSLSAFASAESHNVRALSRHLQKCELNYQSCMKHYCGSLTPKNCSMKTHCTVEYKRYCVSEGQVLAPKSAPKPKPAPTPDQVRAYSRHMQKCNLNYNLCMKRYCSDKTKQCSMAKHCDVEYRHYCVSEGKAILDS